MGLRFLRFYISAIPVIRQYGDAHVLHKNWDFSLRYNSGLARVGVTQCGNLMVSPLHTKNSQHFFNNLRKSHGVTPPHLKFVNFVNNLRKVCQNLRVFCKKLFFFLQNLHYYFSKSGHSTGGDSQLRKNKNDL